MQCMHQGKHVAIQNESSKKINCTLTHQIRTSGYDSYTTGDLVKHSSTYIRVLACRIIMLLIVDKMKYKEKIMITGKTLKIIKIDQFN